MVEAVTGPSVDLDMARRFLAALDPQHRVDATHAFQTFPDAKNPTSNEKWNLTRGGAKHPRFTAAFDDIANELVRLNTAGAGIHVTINGTDGGGREKANVNCLRACACDWDHGNFGQRDGYTIPLDADKPGSLRGIGVGPEPSIVVRTPRGVHWYWLLLPHEEPFDEAADKWRRIQKALAIQYDGDPNVCSTNSTLRVPGFLHQKHSPTDPMLYRSLQDDARERVKSGELDVPFPSTNFDDVVRSQYVDRGGKFFPSFLVKLEKCDTQIRYRMDRLVRGLDLKISKPPRISVPALKSHDISERRKRCSAFMESVKPSVESRYGGDGKAYSYTKGVCGIGGDFGLEPAEFWDILLKWNGRCVPPWDETELDKKLRACHAARSDDFGWRLEQESEEYKRRRQEWQRRQSEQREADWTRTLAHVDEEAGTPRTVVKVEGEKPPEDPAFAGLSASKKGDLYQSPAKESSAGGGGRQPPRRSSSSGGSHGDGDGDGDGDDDGRASTDRHGAPVLQPLNLMKAYATGPDQIVMSHVGNRERFLDSFEENVRYVKTFDSWYVWNGHRWRQDADAEETHVRPPSPKGDQIKHYLEASESDPFDAGNYVQELAMQVIRSMHALADEIFVQERDEDGNKITGSNGKPKKDKEKTAAARKNWISHCVRSESEGAIRQMLNLARSHRKIARFPSYFDPYDYFINTESGVVDMRTGMSYEHHPSLLQSKIVRVRPKRAGCPTWTKFLSRVLQDDAELIRFVQRAVGYSLTGETREQVLFLLYGTGRNGKSTFLNVLHALAGEYAQHAEFSTFIERQSETVRNDLARLHKSRLVTAVEPKASGYLDESVIKQVTGQDVVTARFLFHEHFEYIPRFKIWLAANHKPMIRGNDEGIWRRILMVPFTVTIPEEEKDPDLPNKLVAELPAIFAWALDGARLWYEEGLNAPAAVREATQAYRDEMDTIGMFMSAMCVIADNVRAGATALYERYRKWAERVGEHPMSQKKFGARLEERGIPKKRTKRGYEYQGIGILEDSGSEASRSLPYKDQ